MTSMLGSEGDQELSRPFHLAELAETPEVSLDVTATDAEKAALAKRYGVVAVNALSARVTIRQNAVGDVLVRGTLKAEVVQECVVSLELVTSQISEAFEQRYTRKPIEPEGDLVVGPEDEEPPEPITGETIDIGELVAQFLSLSIDPYPRAPGAEIEQPGRSGDATPDGPFAILAGLRDRENG